jgi:hypothetical protein
MARPLKKSTIEKMDLTVKLFDGSSKKLGKQVGYNKYIVDEESHKIAMLVEKLEKEGDALLILEDQGKDKPVIKIVENLFQTAEKPYGYVLDEDGKVKFLEEGVSIYGTRPDVENAEEAIEEINNIPEGGKGGADIEGDATFSSADHLTIEGNREVSLSVDGTLTAGSNSASVAEGSTLEVEAETVDFSTYAMNVQGEATLTINEGGSFGSEAIVVTGDNASTTIKGGK